VYRLVCFVLVWLLSSGVIAAVTIVEVIPVNNRPAEELTPLLLPLLEPDEQIVANGNSLLVKTQPQRLQTISNLIRKLDNPVNNLLVSVIQSSEITAAQLNAELAGRITLPATGRINIQGGAYYNQNQGTSQRHDTQTIRTMEGVPAHIKAGNAYPIRSYQEYPTLYGYPQTSQSTQYFEATTGFAVTPRLMGNQVNLDVSPWSERANGQGQFQVQDAQTSIRVNLGEWVEIGSVDESGQNNNTGTLAYNNQSSQSRLRILIKVDVVN
jgi:Bacterial type II and III secretion system protein/Bacterial type II/III secretion system short domain